MSDDDRTRLEITILIGGMVNAVLFGAGLITVLSLSLAGGNDLTHASWSIALLVAACLIVSPLVAWAIAPRLRARTWRGRRSDFISG